jgi:hypothetical protein
VIICVGIAIVKLGIKFKGIEIKKIEIIYPQAKVSKALFLNDLNNDTLAIKRPVKYRTKAKKIPIK